MPWIEIHGKGRTDGTKLKEEIFELVEKYAHDLLDKIEVELFDSHCVNSKEEHKPHLRICSSDFAEVNRLVAILKKLKINISTLKLSGFIPAKK